MEKYTEFAVNFLLGEEEVSRLERIRRRYEENGMKVTLEKAFELVMNTGSTYVIREQLMTIEKVLGIFEEE